MFGKQGVQHCQHFFRQLLRLSSSSMSASSSSDSASIGPSPGFKCFFSCTSSPTVTRRFSMSETLDHARICSSISSNCLPTVASSCSSATISCAVSNSCDISFLNLSHSSSAGSLYSIFRALASLMGSSKKPSGSADPLSPLEVPASASSISTSSTLANFCFFGFFVSSLLSLRADLFCPACWIIVSDGDGVEDFFKILFLAASQKNLQEVGWQKRRVS